MIETSTTRWLTPAEVALILPEASLERIVGWAERGALDAWQGPDGWLIPAATAEAWRASSDRAQAMNASGKLVIPDFTASEAELAAEMEDIYWHHEWFSADKAATVLGVAPAALSNMALPKAQELPDGSWRFDDLEVERRRRALVTAGDPAVSQQAIMHHWLGDGHAVG